MNFESHSLIFLILVLSDSLKICPLYCLASLLFKTLKNNSMDQNSGELGNISVINHL